MSDEKNDEKRWALQYDSENSDLGRLPATAMARSVKQTILGGHGGGLKQFTIDLSQCVGDLGPPLEYTHAPEQA